jgi:hypothetical protein
MNDFLLESSDGSMLVQMSVGDRDSSPAFRNVAWSIVNGPLAILNSSSRSGESDIAITVPEALVGSPYLNSLLVNITSESFTLFLPLVLLSTQIGAKMSFTITKLDRSVVRVGFLVNDKISGELVLDGFTLASLVYIAFHSKSGTWLNFTLSGNNGVYEFEISPSYFQIGTHDVYAIAKGQTIPATEVNFATLTVVQDYSVLEIGIASLVACGVVFVILKRRKGETA